MKRLLHTLKLTDERAVVDARQRARSITAALGFDHHDQIRIATAVSEMARNAFRYAREGEVTFSIDPDSRCFYVSVTDHGNGIPHLDVVMRGAYKSTTGMGMGILGTRRLMDDFRIDSTALGTSVEFGKHLPASAEILTPSSLDRIGKKIASLHPASPLDELQTQNRELLRTLTELRERKEELVHLNSELQDTNRGVVALYAELDERADYLRRASELKSSFLSNMSHEFRTPLNSMLALTRMLLDRMDGELTSEQDQQVRFIQQSARELADMVDDLLDLAKVEAGKLEVRAKRFEVDDLFGALRGMLRPLLLQSSLNLTFDIPSPLPPLHTDEQKVSQILRNFISNSIKFTPSGEVNVSARLKGSMVEFCVADTGIGISPSDQRIIFEEFSQVEGAMQKKVKGTGLGLPLSRKLAELLGGEVGVTSEVGSGSVFRLTLPIHFDEQLAEEATSLPQVEDDRQLILIVEDNAETAFIYARYLNAAGFQSHAVTTVESARAVLDKLRPAGIILDMLLGTETSWEFLREIKLHENSVPVLVMSVTDDQHRIFGSGADAYVAKPFVPEQMISELMRITAGVTRPRILMIDDNEVSRYLLREHIPASQYEVFEARDGREGLRMAESLKPSLIFLDFYMPDLNGAEVLRNLRGTPAFATTPIVIHSTKALGEDETEFFLKHSAVIFPKQALTLPDVSSRVRALIGTLLSHASRSGEGAHE